ncbi:MAG: phenylacetate--CoA ligase, partial [Pseudomonadota bacterium]|nr:phenylacetate--CoA ligase [Pseudomonadota bacterium]
ALSPHYQIELSKDRHMDVMTINVELSENADANSDSTSAELVHRIKTFIGVTAKVVVHEPGRIPRSEGKAQRIVDHR